MQASAFPRSLPSVLLPLITCEWIVGLLGCAIPRFSRHASNRSQTPSSTMPNGDHGPWLIIRTGLDERLPIPLNRSHKVPTLKKKSYSALVSTPLVVTMHPTVMGPISKLEELDRKLSRATSDAEKHSELDAVVRYLAAAVSPEFVNDSSGQRVLNSNIIRKKLVEVADRHNLGDYMSENARRRIQANPPPPWSTSLQRIRCANQNPLVSQFCVQDANMLCSGCRLVSYCSAECQMVIKSETSKGLNTLITTNIRLTGQTTNPVSLIDLLHYIGFNDRFIPDCRARLRSSKWKPAWIIQGRLPGFVHEVGGPLAVDFEDGIAAL